MNWIGELQKKDFRGGPSQFGESEIIAYIFKHIQPTNKWAVDIGAGFYGHGEMSNTKQLIEQGWRVIRVDANNDDDNTIFKLYITPDNILPFLESLNVPFQFDLLTIDIDSFDLDILEKVVPAYLPSVICTEYNGTLDPSLSVKLKYEPGYIWDETNKYGYSFGAAIRFCYKYGYCIILNHLNQNLFLVRKDLIPNDIELPELTIQQQNYHPVNPDAEWEVYV